MDAIIEALPLIIAAITIPLVAAARKLAMQRIPPQYLPILIPIGASIVLGVAKALGIDPGDFTHETRDLTAWQELVTTVLVGLAAVGLHQTGKQIKKGADDPEATETESKLP